MFRALTLTDVAKEQGRGLQQVSADARAKRLLGAFRLGRTWRVLRIWSDPVWDSREIGVTAIARMLQVSREMPRRYHERGVLRLRPVRAGVLDVLVATVLDLQSQLDELTKK